MRSANRASRRGQLIVIAIVFSADWGQAGRMHRFQDTLRVLLMILMLPWGAYSAAFGAGVKPAMPVPFANSVETPALPELVAMPQPKQAKIAVVRNCRKAVLPGVTCSPDTVLPANPRLHKPQVVAQILMAGERPAPRGWSDSAPHGPPRAL